MLYTFEKIFEFEYYRKTNMLTDFITAAKLVIISALGKCDNLLCFTQISTCTYRISANSFRGNYSFLNLTLCTVIFGYSTYRCGNYSREETIQGRKLFAEIRYAIY